MRRRDRQLHDEREASQHRFEEAQVMEEDLECLAAKDLHELLRAWELKHRHRTAECVTQHTLFRKETRWPGYYYRGDAMKLDDENWHVLTVSRRDPETGEYTMEKAPCYHLVDEAEEKAAKTVKPQTRRSQRKRPPRPHSKLQCVGIIVPELRPQLE